MIFKTMKHIKRDFVQNNRDHLFIFGDNLQRVGWGGQAAEMRGEWNCVGIATKHSITHSYPQDYFLSKDLNEVETIINLEFDCLRSFIERSKVLTKDSWEAESRFKYLVWPEDGIGTGLSRLPELCPEAMKFIEQQLEWVKKDFCK